MANVEPQIARGVSSNLDDINMENDFPPLIDSFSNTDVELVAAQASVAITHVSETQMSQGGADLNGEIGTDVNEPATPQVQPNGREYRRRIPTSVPGPEFGSLQSLAERLRSLSFSCFFPSTFTNG